MFAAVLNSVFLHHHAENVPMEKFSQSTLMAIQLLKMLFFEGDKKV